MSHLYLQNLIKNATRIIPQMGPSLKKYHIQNSLILNYPLSLQYRSHLNTHKSNALISNQKIRKNNHICLIDTNKIFSSSNFVGASKIQQANLNSKLEQLKKKYQVFNDEILSRMKLTSTIIANDLQKNMVLHDFANLVKSQKPQIKVQNLANKSSSNFLKTLLHSSKISIQTTFRFLLEEDIMKQIKLQEFYSYYQAACYSCRQTNKVKVIFPFSTNFSHSFQPNCQISSVYLTHRRQLLLTIKSIKQIQQNESLTLNYGNLNNYQLLIKYGFAIQNNPHSIFYLPIDFSEIDSIFNQSIEEKMDLLKYQNLKLRNMIKINSKGKIDFENLKMLRIIFLTENFDHSNEFVSSLSQQNEHPLDKQIYQFIKKIGKNIHQRLQYMDRIKKAKQSQSDSKNGNEKKNDQQIRSIKIVQEQERKILKRLIQ